MRDSAKKTSVLVVEDEIIVGLDVAMTLEDYGFVVQGPFKTSDAALESIKDQKPDFAVLDLNLGGDKTSEAVAQKLTELNCPFYFLTGYGASSHPVIEKYSSVKCLTKPIDPRRVAKMIDVAMA
ncbi:response regulator [Marivita sp. S0852]|uniref:response regulator n=1 Tax=Marivita sp. S0852 TaxID=3373893 RepID=UPI00398268B6